MKDNMLEDKLTKKLLEKQEQYLTLGKELSYLERIWITHRIPNYNPNSRDIFCPNCRERYMSERSVIKHIVKCDESLEEILKD